jgi:protein arginine N-methyltransferase 1
MAQDWEIQPALADYNAYRSQDYEIMSSDTVREEGYRRAIESVASGKVILDIGTGAHANWAIVAAQAGAARVYACEVLEDSARKARELVSRLGLADRITIFRGLSTDISLPERVDVCISEVLGCIGSGEGAITVLNDARDRLLCPDGIMIPSACDTLMAAVSLPDALRNDPGFTEEGLVLCARIFSKYGRRFDPRLMLVPTRAAVAKEVAMTPIWVSTSAVVEELRFSSSIRPFYKTAFELKVTRDAPVDGLGLWIRPWAHPSQEPIDTSDVCTSAWVPAFIPCIFAHLPAGTSIQGTFCGDLADDGLNMDFVVEGEIHLPGAPQPRRFRGDAPHHPAMFRSTPMYEVLFRAWRDLYDP